MVDFRQFYGTGIFLLHSAKGSTWEDHKYIKRIDGTYYYPDSYEGGRHLPDGEKSAQNEEPPEVDELTENDVETLANEVIRGNFGNGQIRKDLLGENYQKVQDRVNEIMATYGSTAMTEVPEEVVEVGEKAVKKTTSTSTSKGIDMEKVLSVYRKKGG